MGTGIIRAAAAALVLAALTGGCGWQEASTNLENSRSLRVGMTKEEVLEVMGEPIRNEEYCTPDLWFYYCQPVWVDGLTTEDECMPLVFQDGKLIGWGNEYYSRRLIRQNTPAKSER